MSDCNFFPIHQDLLDHQPQDFLPFRDVQCLGAMAQTSQKITQLVGHSKKGLFIHGRCLQLGKAE